MVRPFTFFVRFGKLLGFLAAFAMMLGAVSQARAEDNKDPKAVEIAHAMMQAMGGENGWNNAHFVRFDFIVIKDGKTVASRSHLWDKYTGRYRYETKTKDGHNQVVLFNTGTKEGKVYQDGGDLNVEKAKKIVEDTYAAYINDMYWLAEPWKWLDGGVNLKYLGEKKRSGETFDEIEITFNHVGLTPGDMYHAFVSQKSHLMTHWEYKLQGGQTGSWDWQYADTGGIKLAKNHVSTDGNASINMGDVKVLDKADDAFFTDPLHALSKLK